MEKVEGMLEEGGGRGSIKMDKRRTEGNGKKDRGKTDSFY